MKHRLLALLLLGFVVSASAFPGIDEWDKKKKKENGKISYGLQVGVSYSSTYVYGDLGLYRNNASRLISRTVLTGMEFTQIKDTNFYAPKIGWHGQAFKFLRFGSDLLVFTDFKTSNTLPIIRTHIGASVHGNLFIIIGRNLNLFESNRWSPRIDKYQLSVIYRLDLIKRNKKKK